MRVFGGAATFIAALLLAIQIPRLEGVASPKRAGDSDAILADLRNSGGKLHLGCGRFRIAKTISLPSNSELSGSGECTVLELANTIEPNMNWAHVPGSYPNGYPASIVSNENFTTGNDSIGIHDLVLDGSGGTGGSRRVHLAAFYRASNVKIKNVRFLGSGTPDVQDGTAFLMSKNYEIKDSYAFNLWNACFDQWDGDHDFIISSNLCDGNRITGHGVIVNGISSELRFNSTTNGVVTNNRIIQVKKIGLGVGGLWNGSKSSPVYGEVRNIRLTHNTVELGASIFGITVSDGSYILVADNSLDRIEGTGIMVGSQFRGVTDNVCLYRNKVQGSETTPGKVYALYITNSSRRVNLARNEVKGFGGTGIRFDGGASDVRTLTGAQALSIEQQNRCQ